MAHFVKNPQDNVETQGDLRAVQSLAYIARFLISEGDYERADGILDNLKDGALTYIANGGAAGKRLADAVQSAVSYARFPQSE